MWKKIPINAYSIDFLDLEYRSRESEKSEKIFQRALESWGENLHQDLELTWDYTKEMRHHSALDIFFHTKIK